MAPYARNMTQVATYWAPGVNDGFGGLSYSGVEPIAIACRWQDDAVLFRDNSGREITSAAVVYVDRPLSIRGYLALGDYTLDSGSGTGSFAPVNPRDVSGALEIRQVAISPSLTGDEALHKCFL